MPAPQEERRAPLPPPPRAVPRATPREAVEEVCFDCFGGMGVSRSEGGHVHEAYFRSGRVRLEQLRHPEGYWQARIDAPQWWAVCSPPCVRWEEALRGALNTYLYAIGGR